jgi:hypothetical protein
LLDCHWLVDWKHARRLVLNFGTRKSPVGAQCAGLNRLEKSELFYAIGDSVYKLSLHAVSSPEGYAAESVTCLKKRGSPRDFHRLRVNCPGRAWTRVTQSDGQCP